MNGEILTLPFLGMRDYLHGTTLFAALSRDAPADAAFSFVISHRIDSNQVEIRDNEIDGEPAAARLTITAGRRKTRKFVYERPPVAPLKRATYDEDLVTVKTALGGDAVIFESASPFDLIATLVPMYKTLLAACAENSTPGQWYLTRYEGAAPAAFEKVELKLKRHVPDRIAQAHISVDGVDTGQIYFSWAP